MKLLAKDKHRQTLIEYLTDPSNDWLTREKLATTVLGYSKAASMWAVFSPSELDDIELEAIEKRRRRYTGKLSQVDAALIQRAIETGDPAAARLIFSRFEGWTEKTKVEQDNKITIQVMRFSDDGKHRELVIDAGPERIEA